MSKALNLEKASSGQFLDFLNSFDNVFTDCDGVLWNRNEPIDGAIPALCRLHALGKKIHFVSNNSTMTVLGYEKKLKSFGFQTINQDQVIIPSLVAAWYLKNIGFEGEAFVISMAAYKEALKNAGINVVADDFAIVKEDVFEIINAAKENSSIKAVICDFEPNCNWLKLMRASLYLKQNDCIFIAGALDLNVPIGDNKSILGPGYFTNIISDYTKRTPILTAKPSELLKEYLLTRYQIKDPARCIFIGDTTQQDMQFSKMCGFQKFFVESGISTIEQAMEHADTVPDVYLSSLGHLVPLLNRFHPTNASPSLDC